MVWAMSCACRNIKNDAKAKNYSDRATLRHNLKQHLFSWPLVEIKCNDNMYSLSANNHYRAFMPAGTLSTDNVDECVLEIPNIYITVSSCHIWNYLNNLYKWTWKLQNLWQLITIDTRCYHLTPFLKPVILPLPQNSIFCLHSCDELQILQTEKPVWSTLINYFWLKYKWTKLLCYSTKAA